MPTDGNPMLTKNLPKVTAADLAISDGLMGDTAERGTALITLEEAMRFLNSQRGYHSNQNLLINTRWDDIKNVINQRGLLEYTATGYGIDMWYKQQYLTLTVNEDNIQIESSKTTSSGLYQLVDDKSLFGKQVTVSILVKGFGSINAIRPAKVFTLTDDYELFSVTYTVPNETTFEYPFIGWSFSNGALAYIKAVKLELGPVQTLAHKEGDIWVLNDPAPDYATELAKCQRYQLMGEMEAIYLANMPKNVVFVPTPNTMRIKPSIIGNPEVRSLNNNSLQENAIIQVAGITNNGIGLAVDNVSEPCYVYFPAGSGLDANL